MEEAKPRNMSVMNISEWGDYERNLVGRDELLYRFYCVKCEVARFGASSVNGSSLHLIHLDTRGVNYMDENPGKYVYFISC
jgi:hypothetical protein